MSDNQNSIGLLMMFISSKKSTVTASNYCVTLHNNVVQIFSAVGTQCMVTSDEIG